MDTRCRARSGRPAPINPILAAFVMTGGLNLRADKRRIRQWGGGGIDRWTRPPVAAAHIAGGSLEGRCEVEVGAQKMQLSLD